MSDTVWQLESVTFDDGGTASGSFTTDSSGYLLSYDIVTTAGTSLGSYEFTVDNSIINYNNSAGAFAIDVFQGDTDLTLQFQFDYALTGNSPDQISTTNASFEQYEDDNSDFPIVTTRAVTAGDAVAPPLCYLRGTRVMTAQGEMPIEDLREGDILVCRFGGLRPIRWIGRQSFKGEAAKGAEPVCIYPGALGANMPRRALKVSQAHSMLIGETLVLARAMVNGVTTKLAAPQAEFDYFQIELDSHDCIMAEGAWSETYADAAELRRQFDNANDFYARFPGYVAPADVSLCAPRPQSGPAHDAALRPVVQRASAGVPAGPLRAWIDIVDAGRIEGWAVDQHRPDLPVVLEIVLRDEVIGTVLACDYRGDLREAGIGRGYHSFTFTSDRVLSPADRDSLSLRRATDRDTQPCQGRSAVVAGRPAPALRLVA